jgi:transcriptional regulator with XRE-family HTH domain
MAVQPPDQRAAALAEFLRACRRRAAADAHGGPRRTPGLRREEVAARAGVSVAYYTRLEQGRGHRPSLLVVDALARALGLDAHERAHLHALAHADNGTPRSRAARLAEPTRTLLELLPAHAAAYVIDPAGDLLACNPLADRLFPGLTAMQRPNTLLYVFCQPAARSLFVDWSDTAADAAAHLRAQLGHHPTDPALTELIARLQDSPEFQHHWRSYEVRPKHTGSKRLLHPTAGPLDLDYQVLLAAAAPDQRVVTYGIHAEPKTRRTLNRLGQRSH